MCLCFVDLQTVYVHYLTLTVAYVDRFCTNSLHLKMNNDVAMLEFLDIIDQFQYTCV